MNKVVIHIGHHKTGTTWLQKKYFSNSSIFNLMNDIEQPWGDPICVQLIQQNNPIASKKLIDEKIDNNRINILSAERFSGHPISGGYDAVRIAQCIKKAIENVQVIIVKREPRDFIDSAYKQVIREGYTGTLKNFLFDKHWKTAGPSKNYFLQDEIITQYSDLFGRDQLLILNFEEFKTNKISFVQKINAFLNIDYLPTEQDMNTKVGSAFSNRRIRALRKLNKCRKSEFNSFPFFKIGDRTIIKLSRLISPAFSNASLRDENLINSFLTKE